MKIMKLISLLISVYLLSNSTYAHRPVPPLTPEDNKLIQENIFNALDHNADGKKSAWQNPKTGASGYALPSHTTKLRGTECRDFIVYNEASHIKSQASYTACKFKGKWKISR